MAIELNNLDLPNWITIIATPPGEAPEEIRKQWIGMVLPASDPVDVIQPFQVPSGEPTASVRVYAVPTKVALLFLISQGKEEAAKWWHDELPGDFVVAGALCFPVEVAKIIEHGSSRTEIELDLGDFPKLLPGYPFN
jgi:hypothetical protein